MKRYIRAKTLAFASTSLLLLVAAAAPPSPPSGQAAPGAATFSMSVTPLGNLISWTKGRSIVASVTVGSVAATNLHVNAALTDDVTNQQFGDADFVACTNADATCTPVTTLPANSTQRLYLRPRVDTEPAPGKYVGTVQLVANEGKSDSAQLTIAVTSGYYRGLGIFFVALGTILSYAITIGVRNRMVRLQMLETVAAVRDRLTVVADQLAACSPAPAPTPITERSIGIVQGALKISTLDRANLLPRLWSLDPASYVNAAGFKDRMDQAAAWTTVISHVVNLGFAQIAHLNARKPAAPAAAAAALQANDQAIATAWGQIDALATNRSGAIEPAPDLATVDAAITLAVSTAQNVVGHIGGGPSDTADSERLVKQVNVLSFASWAVAALLTTLIGSYVMVISHNDFGRLNDLWLCLFWGLGLPTVTQLSQATPSTIAGTVGITLPK